MKSARAFRLSPIALAVISISAANAQTVQNSSATTLAPVQVTAEHESLSSPKYTAPLLNTPQTVQIIPKEVFQQQGARNLTEVLRNTPGITFNAGENGFTSSTNNFSLRGFDTAGNIFVDGFRDSGNYARDSFNLEQVEVIKGPAADNGRGGAAGYVNLETKSPKLQNFTSGSASLGFDSYDSHHRKRITADINRVLNDNTAVRLNLLGENSGIPGREHAKQRSLGVAPSVAFGLNTPTTVTLSYQYVKQDDLPDWGVPGAMVRGTFRYDPAAARAGRDTFFGTMDDEDDVRSHSLLGKIEHRISADTTLSNYTRWSRTDREASYVIPMTYTPATQLLTTQAQAYGRLNKSIGNTTNLATTFQAGGMKHTIATGLELMREESDADRSNSVNSIVDIFNPNPHRVVAKPTVGQTSHVKIDTIALYAYDTIELNPAWQVTGGLRAERYKVDLSSHDATTGASLGAADGYGRKATTLSGKVGLVYKPVSNASIYTSYGQSALPPASYLSNPDASRAGDNGFPGLTGMNHRNSKVQRASNIELGTKWDFFDRRLSTSAAIFRTERSNIAMGPALAEPVGYGKHIAQGIELGVSGSINKQWTVSGGLLYLDTERKHSAAIDAAIRSTGDYGTALSTNGDELAFTPKIAASLWTTYRVSPSMMVGGGIQHVGTTYVGRPDGADRVIKNGLYGKTPSYTLLNLMAAYDLNPKVTLRLNVDNVTNEKYVMASNWNAQRVVLGAPRTFLLSADIKF